MFVFRCMTQVARIVPQRGFRAQMVPIIAANRFQSTCTMDLVSLDDQRNKTGSIVSTLQFSAVERDYSAMIRRRSDLDPDQRWLMLMNTAAEYMNRNDTMASKIDVAEELDLTQAAERRHVYDKILLLLNHGEEISRTVPDTAGENKEKLNTDSLSCKGVGQALDLSRRTAIFCNEETGLVPELFVIEPCRTALQTAFFGFPYDTPASSLHNTRWLCHPAAAGIQKHSAALSPTELEHEFWGVDWSQLDSEQSSLVAVSTEDLLENAENLIRWLYGREEKIIVISGDAHLLQALGCTLNCQGAARTFLNAEMRAIGVSFDKSL